MNETKLPPVLSVRDLRLHYFTSKGAVRALDGVSFDLAPGETLGLVGESGCGKTTTGVALLNMPSPPGRIVSGSILVDGTEIVGMRDRELRRDVRWSKISMVFQGAMNCLTPVYTIRELMLETYREHLGEGGYDSAEAEERMGRYVSLVGLPAHVLGRYPHELSGGMKQRVVIAMALFLEPKVIVMDEPTTALDVTVQAQILDLMLALQNDFDSSIIMITHNLGVISQIADDVAVMYLGRIVEYAPMRELFKHPAHPYTRGLLNSVPVLGKKGKKALVPIEGMVPSPTQDIRGCAFASRCKDATPRCLEEYPEFRDLGGDHFVSCWL